MSIHLNKEDQRVLVAALENYSARRKYLDLAAKDVERAARLARLIGSIELPEVLDAVENSTSEGDTGSVSPEEAA